MRRFNAAFAIACAVVPNRPPSVDLGVQQGSGLRRRALSVNTILERIRDRHIDEVARHNAHVTEDSESRPSIREESLRQFTPKARRLAR